LVNDDVSNEFNKHQTLSTLVFDSQLYLEDFICPMSILDKVTETIMMPYLTKYATTGWSEPAPTIDKI